jgi:multiple sugar transport system ATP-binding protein
VFLLDEPLSNLDAKLRDTMRKEILQLQKNLDITSVYVTHDQTEAMAMGDRVAVMNDGKLQQVGAPESVYRNPVNRFVAGFLGSPSMNFVDVGVHQAEDGYVAFDGPGNFSYRAAQSDLPHGIRNQSEVTLGIRPEDLRITDGGGINSEVNVVEAMGDENIVYTNVGGEEMIARVDSGQKLSNGDSAALEFDVADLYLFDKHTGEALKTKDAMASEDSTAQQQVSTAE